jgi:hypothetical protein
MIYIQSRHNEGTMSDDIQVVGKPKSAEPGKDQYVKFDFCI